MKLSEILRNEMTDWVESTPGNEFSPQLPATFEAIKELESSVGKGIPDDLKEFYKEMNGIWDAWYCFNIMPVEEVTEYNRKLKFDETANLYMSRADHLAFSHADGDYYFYAITPSGYRGIFKWDHEDDSREYVCPDLKSWVSKKFESL